MRTLLRKIREIALLDEPPTHIARAFAIGVFIGMSAFLGVHTLMGLAVAQIFRMNRLAMLVGVYITNPWTIIPIYTFSLVVGAKVMGHRDVLPAVDWSEITLRGFFGEFAHLVVPFLIGTTIVGFVSAIIGFLAVRISIQRYRAGR